MNMTDREAVAAEKERDEWYDMRGHESAVPPHYHSIQPSLITEIH